MMEKTLVLLAAGMGSRYGGLKQLDALGPHGETLMDYSVFDAVRAGFRKIVFIIRRDIEEEFKRVIGSRYEAVADVDALLIVTEWKEFRLPDWKTVIRSMKSPVIFDGRNIYDPSEMKELGFAYYSVGRPTV